MPTPTPTAAGTPGTALQGGLEPRPAMPALVDGELDPCLPLCRMGLVRPGAVSVGERYQTLWFAGGYLTLMFPEPWIIGEDSTGGLAFHLAEDETPDGHPYSVWLGIDLWPSKNGKRVDGVPDTAAGVADWFRNETNFKVIREGEAHIGVLPALAIDIGLSDSAPEQNDDCGAPCVDTLSFEQWDGNGIRSPEVYRYYLADISYGGEDHLLVVEVEGRTQKHLDSLIPRAEAVLATVLLPAHAPAATLAP